ncbi:ATP-dependent helicase [Vallitalea pronyensis]|uniref:ATP-dependent helicase n=1 Tax=Vallitalea pronyensis TaxID=1348613 RepID=A0A8J8SER8_9FIRM|nr:UvrD-helicase domain-containing protein [Vallitalea pronyensis]QUI20891.1 ATP-dependent helicase [Vallitalea pronyensis]
MQASNIKVNESDIKYSEQILLGEGKSFDESRCAYIRDFNTLDLMAVPGSGKTTLLLAKLLVLEKHLPLKNNQAVLVISHTNTAVEEIIDKIKLYCPKLFSYPNFIGTIQSFVNKYLALPYYESICKNKIISIDEENYYQAIKDYYKHLSNYRLKKWLENQHDPIDLLKKIRLNNNSNLVYYISGTEDGFILKNKESSSYKGLIDMKISLLKKGILHYDDAYYLASMYISKFPIITSILQSKFKYIFVDEMQDMDNHQYELLENLFICNHNADICYQRLGDNNQAIYNNIVYGRSVWQERKNIYTINGSNRLSRLNAKMASRFSIDNIQIVGLNSRFKDYKPVLLVYDKSKRKCCVIQAFSEYLNKVFVNESVINNINFKVISWRKFHKDKEKTTLSSYCPNFELMQYNKDEYIEGNSISYYEITRNLIDYLVTILNEATIKINEHIISRTKLLNYLKEENIAEYQKLRLYLFRWCELLFNNQNKEFCKAFNHYLISFTALFHISITKLTLEDSYKFNSMNNTNAENPEERCVNCDVMGYSPKICSAHSVKGETHDATLFLETFYDSNYESDILHEVLAGKNVSELIEKNIDEIKQLEDEIYCIKSKGKTHGIKKRQNKIKSTQLRINRIKQYSKLVYVAVTRPRGVIGYGISKEKYDEYLDGNLNDDEWTVIMIE